MPVIIGWYIGQLLGNMIVGIITLLFRLIRIALKASVHIIRFVLIALEWLGGKLWLGGKGLYENYKLNLR